MGARERTQPCPNGLGQVLRRPGRARAQRHDTTGKGEQVLDAVVHLSEEKVLLFLSSSALGDVPGDF